MSISMAFDVACPRCGGRGVVPQKNDLPMRCSCPAGRVMAESVGALIAISSRAPRGSRAPASRGR